MTIEKIADAVWRFFSSVRLAVVLLIILAIVSIIGTIVQQNAAPEQYLQEYSASTIRLLEAVGLFDMYHAWWFVLLLFLLTANLIVCSLERFPHTWKAIKTPLSPLDDACLHELAFKKSFSYESGNALEERLRDALRTHRYKLSELRKGSTLHLMAEKGKYTRLGVYITHASIVLIILGALIGTFFGFKAFLSLPEGSESKIVYLRSEPLWEKVAVSLGIAKNRVQWDPESSMPTWPLDFTIRCDEFDVDYYVNPSGMPTGMPSEYHSTLSILDSQGEKILTKRITVNDPLAFRGMTFYQSSYGSVPGRVGTAVLEVSKKGASPESISIPLGESKYITSIDRTFKVTGFAPFVLRDPYSGEIGLYRTENNDYINPAVQIEIYKGKKLLQTTEVIKIDRHAPVLPDGYSIKLLRFSGTRFTGLQVTKDPGVWVVYLGFILLCIGPLIAFFGSHKKLWARIEEQDGRASIILAGSANKNRQAFEREFSSIAEEIRK